jgi:tetratricopeptide (TPR) repeat protein
MARKQMTHDRTSRIEPLPDRRTQLLVFVFLVAVVGSVFFAYRQGLPGQFMFDDYPNLETLSKYGGIHDLTSLKLYLDESFSGPTGRPISMLSFLIDVRDWPADPGPTKLKNVLIHLLNGLLLFWLLTACLRQSSLGGRPSEVLWVASLGTGLWVLHPLHVSTVLYAIQRMAELAAFFVLLGLGGYATGRRLLASHPTRAYGAIFLWVPTVAVLGATAYFGATAADATWHMRGFTAVERLFTECRIVFDYLLNLFIPRPDTGGIFRDSLTVSTTLLNPVTTLPAVLGVVSLIAGAVLFRKRLPLLSAAILFYFAGHVVESTLIPLELYFEHRNYLPSVLLFLPVAQLLVWSARSVPKPATIGALIILTTLGACLVARADLWSDRASLYVRWANENPHSPRAQLSAINVLQRSGGTDAALQRLTRAISTNPDSLALHAHRVRIYGQADQLKLEYVRQLRKVAKTANFTGEAVVAMRRLTDETVKGTIEGVSNKEILEVWHSLAQNENYTRSMSTQSLIHYETGRLHTLLGDEGKALQSFRQSLSSGPHVQTAMMQAGILATNGYYCDALSQLRKAQQFLSSDPDIRNNREYYAAQVRRLRRIMTKEADEADKKCLND